MYPDNSNNSNSELSDSSNTKHLFTIKYFRIPNYSNSYRKTIEFFDNKELSNNSIIRTIE